MWSRIGLLLWCCALPLLAQQSRVQPSPSDPVFEAETVLMEVEVKVTDRQGRPVPDLKAEDFTLLENGQPQVIRTFEYVTEPGSDVLIQSEGSAPEQKPVRLNEPMQQDRLPSATTWVYVTGRVNPEDRKLVWRQMNKFLDGNLRPGVLVSIEGSDFTSQRPALEEGLREMIEGGGTPGSLPDLKAGLDGIRYGEIEYDPQYQARVDNLNGAFADLAQQQTRYFGAFFLYRYIDLVESLSVLPGKKVVVLLTGGALGTNENSDIMRRLIAEAIRARVTFYVVETPRLSAKHPYIPDATFPGYALPPGGSQRFVISSAETNHPTINLGLPPSTLSNPTGGKAAYTILGLGRVLTAASQALRGYYLIGYSPREPDSEDRRRRIRVEVRRPGVKLDYRKSHYEPVRFSRLSPTEKKIGLRHYLKHDIPFTDIPLTMAYDFFQDDDGKPVLYTSVGIHSSYLPVGKKKKRSDIRFVVLAQALDVKAEKDPLFVETNVRIRASSKYLENFQKDPSSVLHVPLEMQLAPGTYSWKVVLRDEHNGKIGSYKTQVVLPDFGGQEPSSSLLLTGCYSAAPRRPGKRRGGMEGVIGEGKRFYTDSSHTYGKGDPVYLIYDLYGVQVEEESALPETKLMLMRGQQQIDAPKVTDYQYQWSSDHPDVRYVMALDTNDLEPGGYQLLSVLPSGKEAIYRNFRVVAGKRPDLWLDPDYALMGCGIQ
jgi:VWFA-related protein